MQILNICDPRQASLGRPHDKWHDVDLKKEG